MTDRAKIENAKNLAAVKALEAYAACLQEQLTPEELKQVEIHNTDHVHLAVLLLDKSAVAVRAHWNFSSDPEVVAQALSFKKGQGVA